MFQFFFQSGEFVGENNTGFLTPFFVQFFGTLGAAAIAIWQYRESIKRENRKKKAEEEKLYKEKLSYFLHLIDGSINFGNSLIGGLKTIEKNFRIDIFQGGQYATKAWDDLIRIVERENREPYFHGYLSFIKSNEINTIFSDLDSLNRLREISFEKYKLYIQNGKELLQILFTNDVQISKIIQEINPVTYSDITQDSAQEIHTISLEYNRKVLNDKQKHLKSHEEHLLNKLLDSIQKHYPHNYKRPTIIKELFHICMQNVAIVHDVKTFNEKYLTDLIEDIPQLEQLIKRLEINSTPLRLLINNT